MPIDKIYEIYNTIEKSIKSEESTKSADHLVLSFKDVNSKVNKDITLNFNPEFLNNIKKSDIPKMVQELDLVNLITSLKYTKITISSNGVTTST